MANNRNKASYSRSRDIGITNGAGKGSADRTDSKQSFDQNFAEIQFPEGAKPEFKRSGHKLVKKYGATLEQTRTAAARHAAGIPSAGSSDH